MVTRAIRTILPICLAAGLAAIVQAQSQPATWSQPQKPFRIFGDTYYVGTRGLTVLLIKSPAGAVLVDGAIREAAADVAKNITALGMRLEDVKVIVNSHVHSDHAGALAELQRLTGASVAALPWSARVLREGRKDRADPQFETAVPAADTVAGVREVQDGEVLKVGSLSLTAHKTGGHTPGGTSWTWRSCEGDRCADIVYADSITSVSADGFRFSDNRTYPQVLDDFASSFKFLRSVSCDILLTPHPEASEFWERVARRDSGERDALIDRTQCARYVDRGESQLRQRLEKERRQ